MLNLDQITFSADTSQLDTAAKKIEALGTALSALSVDLNKLDKESAKAAKTQAEAKEIAKQIARNQNSEVIIQGQDGKIREKNSYGNDPKNVKG